MRIHKLLLSFALLISCAQVNAKSSNNPFEKVTEVKFGADVAWSYEKNAATKSAADTNGSGDFYHLKFDTKQLRLRIGNDIADTDSNATSYEQLAIEDVLIDGKRLPLFQWCLSNQQKHSRFLQQGLSVKKGICRVRGANGAFTMMLNKSTLGSLEGGKELTFIIKPFRSKIELSYDIAGFSTVAAKLKQHSAPKRAAAKATAPVAAPARVAKKCTEKPPAGFSKIKPVEYNCASAKAKAKAKASIAAAVSKERDRKKQTAASRAEEEKQRQLEEQAIAASQQKQKELTGEITKKMIGVCKKKWAEGEHRCYCEKYLEHAPPGIKSDPSC